MMDYRDNLGEMHLFGTIALDRGWSTKDDNTNWISLTNGHVCWTVELVGDDWYELTFEAVDLGEDYDREDLPAPVKICEGDFNAIKAMLDAVIGIAAY